MYERGMNDMNINNNVLSREGVHRWNHAWKGVVHARVLCIDVCVYSSVQAYKLSTSDRLSLSPSLKFERSPCTRSHQSPMDPASSVCMCV